jgi:hypothetical protein
MSDEDRCESLARVGVTGVESYRCRQRATRHVQGRRVCTHHITVHVFHDADPIGEAQRERAARVMAD